LTVNLDVTLQNQVVAAAPRVSAAGGQVFVQADFLFHDFGGAKKNA
jgi:hypothetical protein